MNGNIIYLLCILVCNEVYAQDVELYYDTINIISIKRVDTINNAIKESSQIVFFKDAYYQANNFPFDVLKTKCSVKRKDNMFYAGYSPIINKKSINYLKGKIKKNVFVRIDHPIDIAKLKKPLANESMEILYCLKTKENGVFLISEQKAIAAFLIVDCGFEGGVHDAIFCKEKLNIFKTPVLLNVTEIIK